MGGARSSETKEPSSGESSPVGGEQSNSSREPLHPGCFFYGQVRFADVFFRTRIFQVSSSYDGVVICLVLSTSLKPHAVFSRVQAFVRRYQGPRLRDHCRNGKCRLQFCVTLTKGRRFNCNRLVFLVHRTCPKGVHVHVHVEEYDWYLWKQSALFLGRRRVLFLP